MSSLSFKSIFSFLVLAASSLSLLPITGAAQSSVLVPAKVVSVGDYVRINTYNTTLNLRNAPCGTVIGSIAPMSTGRVASDAHNNHKMSCNGGNWTWVKVDFANVSGFVAAQYLLKHDMEQKEAPKMEPKKVIRFSCAPGFDYDSKSDSCHKVLVKPAEMPKVQPHANVWMTGSKVWIDTAVVPVQVRATPCGDRMALAWPKKEGILMSNEKNFVSATCNGGTYTWVQVDFGNRLTGWVASQYLKSSVVHHK